MLNAFCFMLINVKVLCLGMKMLSDVCRKPLILLVIFIFSCPVLAEQEKVISTISEVPGGANLAVKLIKEIVKIQGEYTLNFPYEGQDRPTVTRLLADIDGGTTNLIWALSSPEFEEKYQAVFYPLYFGMFGMRLPIVKKSEIDQFKDVRTVHDLKDFSAGQGVTWSDTTILRSNNLEVVGTNKYHNLFPMLEGDRFDYFPRTIHEPWGEVINFSQYELAVDPYIMLRYKVGFYFFVRKDDVELYEYIVRGMEALTQSGRHKELFFQEEDVKLAMANANLADRVIIDLHNPGITPQTPIDREELWFDIYHDPSKDVASQQ